MKITIKKTGNTITPSTPIDTKLLELKRDGYYIAEIKKQRSVKHNAKYWLLCQALCFHYDKTPELWHEFLKRCFLGFETHEFLGKKVELNSSTAFEKMDQEQFNIYFQQIISWLNDNGVDIDELIGSM